MKSSKLFWLGLVMLALLAGCASSPNAPTSSSTSTVKLDDSLVSRIAAATQSGAYQTPLDATPDLNGSTIYFTAHGPHGAGVFQVPAAGGAATEVFTGKPFLSPRGLTLSADGQQLYVADPTAGQIFVLSVTGGTPTVLKGSAGTAPQNLSIVQQTLYFTGIDPASKLAALLKLPIAGADAPTVIARGAPLVAPIGVNLSTNRGFRRGEGGCVDVGWAFMVTRCGLLDVWIGNVGLAHPHPAGDHKGPPNHASPRSPLRMMTGFS